jgi:hypothetical protein
MARAPRMHHDRGGLCVKSAEDPFRLADIQRRDPLDNLLTLSRLLQHQPLLVPAPSATAARGNRKGQANLIRVLEATLKAPTARLPAPG